MRSTLRTSRNLIRKDYAPLRSKRAFSLWFIWKITLIFPCVEFSFRIDPIWDGMNKIKKRKLMNSNRWHSFNDSSSDITNEVV